MTISIDLVAKRVEASVRSLLEQGRPRLRGRGEFGGLRAALGAQLHRDHQARQYEAPIKFEAEVEVSLETEVDGFTVCLRGRMDGLYSINGRKRVEEVKSTPEGAEQLEEWGVADVREAADQALLYALCLAQEVPPDRIDVVVHLISILDDAHWSIEVPFELGVARELFEGRVRQAIEHAERQRERQERWAAMANVLELPFAEPRPHQLSLIDAIAAALARQQVAVVSAPTGVGKTMSALLPTLRHAMRSGSRLFFATSKTSQQALVASAYQSILDDAELDGAPPKATTLRARHRMCPPGHLRCHPKVCPFLVDFDARADTSGARTEIRDAGPVLDPDLVETVGRQHTLCPYELQMDAAGECDVLIGDYNYVFDPAAALTPFVEPTERPFVVVVDEAHNLPDRARAYATASISQQDLERAQAHVDVSIGRRDASLAADLTRLVAGLRSWIDERLATAAELELTGVDDSTPLPITDERWPNAAVEARRMMLRYGLFRFRNAEAGPGDPLLDLLRVIVTIDETDKRSYRGVLPYVGGPASPSGASSGMVCVASDEILAPVYGRTAGAVVMSATLAPTDTYVDALGLSGAERTCIDVPPIFPPEHRLICIDPSVRLTRDERDAAAPVVAERIRTVISAREGRYAVFFSSYAYLGRVQSELGLPRRDVVVSLPGMTLAQRRRMLDGFVNGPTPRLLLAVTSGSFAEGIDLPAEALIGAIVVGPALPSVGFERELMRQYFDDAGEAGFGRAYLVPGLRGVVQAAGRVIRTMSDRGVIVLLGERFTRPDYLGSLPTDWLGRDPHALARGDLGEKLASFWDSAGPTPNDQLG